MKLSKLKRKNKRPGKNIKTALTGIALSAMLLSCTNNMGMTVMADGVNLTDAIAIEKPSGWKQGNTVIHVTVDASNLEGDTTISKIEAKIGDGEWQDILSSMSVTIASNTTVYVRVTDSKGNIYEQNRSIRCYDVEKPTLSAALSDGILTIQGQDTYSGISKITVNGTDYNELRDGLLKIQLTQKDFTTKKIEISVTDGAGNTSDTYSLQNPYYEWAVKQAIAQQADSSDNLSTTTENGSTEEKKEVTAPLPQSATPSEPTEARGTVEDRTVTGIEQELAQKNETVDTISSTTTAAGKEFYTISTKSGKVFYLIIDNESSSDNVYFLTEVDNEDLMNFTLSDTVTLPAVDTVYATLEETPFPTPSLAPIEETEPEEEEETPEVQTPDKPSNMGSYLMIGLLCAGAFAGAYYFKIYKPKHEQFDEDEYEGDDYEESREPEYSEEEEREVMEDEED